MGAFAVGLWSGMLASMLFLIFNRFAVVVLYRYPIFKSVAVRTVKNTII